MAISIIIFMRMKGGRSGTKTTYKRCGRKKNSCLNTLNLEDKQMNEKQRKQPEICTESIHKEGKTKQDTSRLIRNTQIKIRLTEAERAMVKKTAAKAQLSLADYLMTCIRNKPIVIIPNGARIRSELIREGRNLNYALYLANIARKNGQEIDWRSIQDAIAKVEANLDVLSETIKKWNADISSQVENR